MNLVFKKPQPKDWKIIQHLNNLVFLNDSKNDDDLNLDWPFSDQGVKYYKKLASGKYGYCLIAYSNKKAVGYIALRVKKFGYRKSKYIEIENMGVVPSHRSKGVGKKLIEKAVEWATSRNAKRLYVAAYWKNKNAIKFYEKNGFQKIGLELDKKV